MKCPSCDAETNPTLLYCTACGGQLDADVDDVFADEAKKAAERRLIEATVKAREILVLGVFLLACAIGLRVVLVKKPSSDRETSFRVPYAVIEEAGADPSATLQIDELAPAVPDADYQPAKPKPKPKPEPPKPPEPEPPKDEGE
jgi:hypothetical protein